MVMPTGTYTKSNNKRLENGGENVNFSVSLNPLPGTTRIVDEKITGLWNKFDPFSSTKKELQRATENKIIYQKRAQKLLDELDKADEYIKSNNPNKDERVKIARDLEGHFKAVQEAAARGDYYSKQVIELAEKRRDQWFTAGMCNVY